MNTRRLQRTAQLLTEVAIATPRVSNAKVSAALLHRGRVVALGVNSEKTNPFQLRYSKNQHALSMHAETAAIRNALRHLSVEQISNCVLVVCRVRCVSNRPGHWIWGLSRPCQGCCRAIAEFGIREVWYTTDQQQLQRL